MITRIEIDGFKTFSDFTMEFTPFTVIAGTNASGKSNMFDAFNLLSNLANTDIRSAFRDLRGDAEEQFTRYTSNEYANKIKLAIEILVDKTAKDKWGDEINLRYTRFRYEIHIVRVRNTKGFDDLKISYEHLSPIQQKEDAWVKNNIVGNLRNFWKPKVDKDKRRIRPYIFTEEKELKQIIKISMDGIAGRSKKFSANEMPQTALSSVDSVEFPHVLAAKNEMLNWRFLQLNPEELRKPSSRIAPDTISRSGANMAAALYRLKQDDEYALNDISVELNNLLPNFIKVNVFEEVSENRFVIKLTSDDHREFSSRVLSEGTLRILILCILKYDQQHRGTICFEEPENGIHPYRLKMMIRLLKGLSTDFSDIEKPLLPLRQMIVNTHSARFVENVLTQYKTCKDVSIWFSKLVSKEKEFADKKIRYRITRLLPVSHDGQYKFDFLEQSEIAMTNLEVEKYLDTQDFGS